MPPLEVHRRRNRLGIVVAYVRNMNAVDAASIELGSASQGRAIFEGKGECLKCHAVNDRGSVVAPDLSDIGATRAPVALQRHLTASERADDADQPAGARGDKDGKTINGRRLNEDTYTVQIMDDRATSCRCAKADVREFRF